MSLPHKNTGDLLTADEYNAMVDLCNGALPTILTGNTQVITDSNLFAVSTGDDVSNGIVINPDQARLSSFALDATTANFQVENVDGTAVALLFIQTETGRNSLRFTPTSMVVSAVDELGLVDAADYSVNGKQTPLWKATWGAVLSLYDSGIATLVNGQVTVNSTLVKTISRQITLNYNSASGTLGILAALGADIIDNTSFVIKSLNPDGTVNTADNSQVRYCVIGD